MTDVAEVSLMRYCGKAVEARMEEELRRFRCGLAWIPEVVWPCLCASSPPHDPGRGGWARGLDLRNDNHNVADQDPHVLLIR